MREPRDWRMRVEHIKIKKPRRMVPYTRLWERLADREARNWAPPVVACKDCGGPVISGHCCNRCGSVDPRGGG